jgi:hypothetical protein
MNLAMTPVTHHYEVFGSVVAQRTSSANVVHLQKTWAPQI